MRPAAATFEVQGHYGTIAAEVWRPAAETVVFMAHATGFCKEVWRPVVGGLLARSPSLGVVVWDAAAHGHSQAGSPPYDWWDLARDALLVVGSVGAERSVGIGHSMGAATLAMAEVEVPGSFERLLLIEPIIFPPPFERFDHPLVRGALRRKDRFGDRRQARANFEAKPIFAGWDERAMDGYVEGALVESAGGVRLRCSPSDEADFYRGGSAHGAYARLGEIDIPVSLLAGEESTTHPEPFVGHLRERFGNASATVMADAGHFLPMERPDEVAALIARFLG